MIVLVDLALLQSVSYIAGALGVCIAAIYYVQILRNTEREKRRQTILMRLPSMTKEYWDCYYYLYKMRDWTTPQEFRDKHQDNPEVLSKIAYTMNIYNTVGILYQEGLMSIDDIAQLYTPFGIIGAYERFRFLVPMQRLNSLGEEAFLGYWAPLEHLYNDMKRRYPDVERWMTSPEETAERRRLREVNVFSKWMPQ